MKFRKKPIVIEANRIMVETFWDICIWCGGDGVVPHDSMDSIIRIKTLEGVMEAGLGDWIIQGVNGEFYPCKDDIFRKTYEPVVE